MFSYSISHTCLRALTCTSAECWLKDPGPCARAPDLCHFFCRIDGSSEIVLQISLRNLHQWLIYFPFGFVASNGSASTWGSSLFVGDKDSCGGGSSRDMSLYECLLSHLRTFRYRSTYSLRRMSSGRRVLHFGRNMIKWETKFFSMPRIAISRSKITVRNSINVLLHAGIELIHKLTSLRRSER